MSATFHETYKNRHDYPNFGNKVKETVTTLKEHGSIVYGVRLLTEMQTGCNLTTVCGYQVIHEDYRGVKGITEFGLHGYAVRDTMVHEV